MNIFPEEEILKFFDTYNPWWKTGMVKKSDLQNIKRISFYKAKETFLDSDIRRFVLLSGARRVGKTTIMYQLINELLNKGVNEKNIFYVSLNDIGLNVKWGFLCLIKIVCYVRI